MQGAVGAAQWSAYQTAVDYQFYHGLGMVAAGILADRLAGARVPGARPVDARIPGGRIPGARLIACSGWVLLAGIVGFSGSIYATTFGAPSAVGAAAPLGGLAMMTGWLLLALGVWRAARARRSRD